MLGQTPRERRQQLIDGNHTELSLTETMESNPGLGLDSYDRFFPNQDTLPRGGFGNLIALPLQKAARNQGNSVFVDEQLQVIGDQWTYLASIKKISRIAVEHLVEEAEAKGRVVGERLVIEIDGMQHLSSKDAYRTDRRKDLLLQEHGYIVLRFLASDVSKRLDVVLDTILRVLNSRERN